MEYGITAKPSTFGSTMSNTVLERIHQVLESLVCNFNISTQTYVDEDEPQKEILSAAAFTILSLNNRQKVYSPGQLIFGCDMILLIKHRVDSKLIRQKKQTQINRYNTQHNKHRVEYAYKVRDTVIPTNHTAYENETPYNDPFVIK